MYLRDKTDKKEKKGDDPCQLHAYLLFGYGRNPLSDFRPLCHPWTELKVVNPIRKEMSSTPRPAAKDETIDFDNIVGFVLHVKIFNCL